MKQLKPGKYLCPVCKGKGRVYDHFAGIFTLGISYLVQASDEESKDICTRCEGKGYIEI